MEIKKVKAAKNGALVVVIPKKSGIEDGDFIRIDKLEINLEVQNI